MPGKTRLRINSATEADIELLDAYGAGQFDQGAADAYTRRLYELFDLLRAHPLAGQAGPDYGRGLRRISFRKHRIFYRVDGDLVVIVRIIHHARDAKRELEG